MFNKGMMYGTREIVSVIVAYAIVIIPWVFVGILIGLVIKQ